MTDISIALVYFSATQVTHTYVQVISRALQARGCAVETINVTSYAARQRPLPLKSFTGFLFGVPVFSDFAPSVINDWLPTLDGKGKPCAQFLTYGARTTGYAHFHTRLLLEQAGFVPLLSAEFLGRHSFNVGGWRILPDRPGEGDFAVAREFAVLALERFSQEAPEPLVLQKPFGYDRALAWLSDQPRSTARRWTHPARTADTCSMCRDCETGCPSRAFDADSGRSDPATCIECMHCVAACPDRVIAIDPRFENAYDRFLSHWHLTEEMMRAKKSRIIATSGEAAA